MALNLGKKAKLLNLPQLAVMITLLAALAIILAGPLACLFSKAFMDNGGGFVGLDNYRRYFGTPALAGSIFNTLDISLVSAFFSLCLALAYAYALTRTNIRGKTFFKYAALAPIFIPTIVHALGLIYLFGRQGLITALGFKLEIYGRTGIILSEIIYTFPQAFLMFHVALETADNRLYEAADSLGCSPATKFLKITLPGLKYTLVNVFFVCFTLAFTDFGAPKVLGGSYNVLATDIYKQIAGQFNMNMGAVVGTLLLVPALISFLAGGLAEDRSTLTAKSTRLRIKPGPGRDAFFFIFCVLMTLALAALVLSLLVGAFTTRYPYNLAPTLDNFKFNISTGGLASYFNSLKMSGLTALFGALFVFIYAYMMEKARGLPWPKKAGRLLAVVPLALPGLVVGISFIFFFNSPANPLNFIYGTLAILVLSNILHYFSVPFLTATGALKKLDREIESVAESLNIPKWKTFLQISVPLSWPALLEIAMYFFVNSMVTVSAVVFLYSPGFKIASIAITHMEEAGDFAQAAAMSLLILGLNLLVRLAYELAVWLNRHLFLKRKGLP
ncbi:MAG: putative 2-aminoethylphosphonate ABC transporter permease subunit [Candidatus Adiutrix sp.]|jgi:iron(III) transport system permease protein|nr:putative 2-aminoethylphosphonate ABC transporter permease subunit [Candidatus Adiutrix sp.]